MYINLYKIYNLYWHTWKFGGDRLSCFGVVAMSKKDVNSTFVENISSVLLTSRNINPRRSFPFHFDTKQTKCKTSMAYLLIYLWTTKRQCIE
jgi:hypothetical protein